MQTFAVLPNGTFIMSYEMCRDATNADHACEVYIETSNDGLNWGTVGTAGSLVSTPTAANCYTPHVSWTPGGGPNGTVLLSGDRRRLRPLLGRTDSDWDPDRGSRPVYWA